MERGGGRGPASWGARVLAPLALIASALVVVLIVSASLGDESEDGGGGEETRPAQSETGGCTPSDEQALENGYYVIEGGENLTTVSEATCIPAAELIELNPNLDPQLVPVSACVDLVPDGCKALADG